MKTVEINEAIKVPGTRLILESGDKILFRESDDISYYLEKFKDSYRTEVGTERESFTKIDYNLIKEFMESIPFPITSMNIGIEGNHNVTWNSETKEALFYAYGNRELWGMGFIPFHSKYKFFYSKNLDYMKSTVKDFEKIIRSLSLNRAVKVMEPLFERESKLRGTGRFIGKFDPYSYLKYCVELKTSENLLKKLSKKPDISTWIKTIRSAFAFPFKTLTLMDNLDEVLELCLSPIEKLVFGKEVSREWLESIGVSIGNYSERPIADPMQSKALKSFAGKLSVSPEDIVNDLEEYMKDVGNGIRRHRNMSEAVYGYLAEFIEYVYGKDLMDYYNPYYGFPGKILYYEVIQPIEIKLFGVGGTSY